MNTTQLRRAEAEAERVRPRPHISQGVGSGQGRVPWASCLAEGRTAAGEPAPAPCVCTQLCDPRHAAIVAHAAALGALKHKSNTATRSAPHPPPRHVPTSYRLLSLVTCCTGIFSAMTARMSVEEEEEEEVVCRSAALPAPMGAAAAAAAGHHQAAPDPEAGMNGVTLATAAARAARRRAAECMSR